MKDITTTKIKDDMFQKVNTTSLAIIQVKKKGEQIISKHKIDHSNVERFEIVALFYGREQVIKQLGTTVCISEAEFVLRYSHTLTSSQPGVSF